MSLFKPSDHTFSNYYIIINYALQYNRFNFKY